MNSVVYLKSPQTGELKAVEANPEALTPLMAAGWHQVPAPAPAEPKVIVTPAPPNPVIEEEKKK